MELAQLTTFLGWCTVINFAFLLLATVALTALRGVVMRVHGSLLPMKEDDLKTLYVTYLANYKILAVVFNLVPWIALKIM